MLLARGFMDLGQMNQCLLFPRSGICLPYSRHFKLTVRHLRTPLWQQRILMADHLEKGLLSLRRAGRNWLNVPMVLCQPEGT